MKKFFLFLFLALISIDVARSKISSLSLAGTNEQVVVARNAEGTAPVDEVMMVTPTPHESSVGGPPPSETPYDDKAMFKKTDPSDNPYNGADKKPSSD